MMTVENERGMFFNKKQFFLRACVWSSLIELNEINFTSGAINILKVVAFLAPILLRSWGADELLYGVGSREIFEYYLSWKKQFWLNKIFCFFLLIAGHYSHHHIIIKNTSKFSFILLTINITTASLYSIYFTNCTKHCKLYTFWKEGPYDPCGRSK